MNSFNDFFQSFFQPGNYRKLGFCPYENLPKTVEFPVFQSAPL
jgi:hypothetical protein